MASTTLSPEMFSGHQFPAENFYEPPGMMAAPGNTAALKDLTSFVLPTISWGRFSVHTPGQCLFSKHNHFHLPSPNSGSWALSELDFPQRICCFNLTLHVPLEELSAELSSFGKT